MKGMDVVAYGEANTVLGYIHDVVVHPEDFRVLGYIVRSGWGLIEHRHHLVLTADVNKIGMLFTINDYRSLLPIDAVIAINSILESTGYLLGKPIKTATKQKLGYCRDLIVDTSYHQVRAFVPMLFFRKKPALPVTAVKKITKKAIVTDYQVPLKQKEEIEQLSLLVDS
jgi:uncharacterized protein YrrD